MAGNLHLAPFVAQYTIMIDQERAALDAHVLATVQALLADHVEIPAQLLVGIAEQVKGQFLLLAELRMRLQVVTRHAQHDRIGAPEARMQVAELARFNRTRSEERRVGKEWSARCA